MVHHRVYKSLPLDPIQNHFSAFHIFTPYLSMTHFNIIIQFTPRSSFEVTDLNIVLHVPAISSFTPTIQPREAVSRYTGHCPLLQEVKVACGC
jgi:hypothetical protein